MKVPSPTFQQSAVSDPRTRLSPTSSSSIRSKTKIVRRLKHGSGGNNKSSGRSSSFSSSSSSSSMKQQLHPYDNISSNSPYYKGLLDQSLAILEEINADAPCTQPHSNPPCYPAFTSHNLSSGGHSPYYKGLTDYSLVISSWSRIHENQTHNTPLDPVVAAGTATATVASNPLSYQSSPYYRGLIDYSLVLHAPQLPPHSATRPDRPHILVENLTPPPPSCTLSSPSTLNDLMTIMADADDDGFLTEKNKPLTLRVGDIDRRAVSEESTVGSAATNPPLSCCLIDYSLALPPPHQRSMLPMPFYLKSTPDILENLTPPTCASTPSTLNEFMMTTKGYDADGFLTEKDPLRDIEMRVVSKQGMIGTVFFDEQPISEEMEELVTKGPAGDDTGSVIGEKTVPDQAIMVENVTLEEENADKTSLKEVEQLMTNGDAELVINAQEKPLRERVSEVASKVGSEDMELGIEEEKPLRERVLEASNVDEEKLAETTTSLKEMDVGSEKEKPLFVSEQTVASSDFLPCKDEGNVSVGEVKSKDTAEEGSVYEYTWATKHQPMTLEGFICNRDKALQLKALVREGCGCNHFIFKGPPNVGKRSMIRAMLREVFGAERVQVIKEWKDFNLKGEMVEKIQVQIKKSQHHVEVNISEMKGYEKHVITDLFKETYGKIVNNSLPCSPENCQAIILYEAEKLSIESLLYIKWLLEKYKGCNKVFFCCSDESKLQPVKPLCATVRLSPPSSEEILKILDYIGEQEGIKLSYNIVKKIILRSKNNLRQAIRSLEATCRNKVALKDDDVILTGWEFEILNIAKNILEEQSPRQLYLIRRKLRRFMIHDVPPSFVYKFLVAELTTLVDASLRSGVAKLGKEYNDKASEIGLEAVREFGGQNKQRESDERNNEPTKRNASSYLKVEEFVAKFMSWYKNSTEKSNRHVQLIAGT